MKNSAIEEKLSTFAHYMGRILEGAPLAQEYLQDLVETAYKEGYAEGFFQGQYKGMTDFFK